MDFHLQEITTNLGIPTKTVGILYHYTSSEALLGILENQKQWISQIKFLNDFSELKLVLNKVIAFIEKERKNRMDNDSSNGQSKEYKEYVINSLKGKKNFSSSKMFKEYVLEETILETINMFFSAFDIFVFSMSEDPDSLPIWSNYSKGGGYNIGFEIDKLLDIFGKDKIRFIHGQVIYDENKQDSILKSDLRTFKGLLSKNITTKEEEIKANALLRVFVSSIFFKKACFKVENEYRYVFFRSKEEDKSHPIKYRIINNSIIPYIEIPISYSNNLLPIKFITMGPKNNMDLSKMGLEYLLKKSGYKDFENIIKTSEITLRY